MDIGGTNRHRIERLGHTVWIDAGQTADHDQFRLFATLLVKQ